VRASRMAANFSRFLIRFLPARGSEFTIMQFFN